MPASNQGRTLERALDILEHLSTLTQPAKLSAIAKETGLHVATAQRMLNNLTSRGYISHTALGYTLGPGVLPLAWGFSAQDRLATIAHPLLVSITEGTTFTSSIFVRSNDFRVLTARVEAPNPMHYRLSVGQRMGLTLGGGKVFLAYQDPQSLQDFFSTYEGEPLTQGFQTPTDLRSDLETIRQQGYYLSSSERDAGTISLTLPLWDSNSRLSGTLSTVTTQQANDTPDILSSLSYLTEAARLISLQL